MASFRDTNQNDRLVGTAAADDFTLDQGGADTVEAGGGNDRVNTRDGDDWVFGGSGDDNVFASGGGNNVVFGGGGADSGNDNIRDTGGGNDQIFAGAGDDTIFVQGGGTDFLGGGAGNDVISVGPGVGVTAGSGNVTAFGATGNDQITLNATESSASSIGRVDAKIYAGSGNDTVSVAIADGKGVFEVGLGAGDDYAVISSDGTLFCGSGADTVEAQEDTTDTNSEAQTIWGGAGNDVILLFNAGARQTVAFDDGHGIDVVSGFDPREDVLDFRAISGDADGQPTISIDTTLDEDRALLIGGEIVGVNFKPGIIRVDYGDVTVFLDNAAIEGTNQRTGNLFTVDDILV